MTVYALGKKNKLFMTGKNLITYKFYKAPHTRLSLETTKCARLLISIP